MQISKNMCSLLSCLKKDVEFQILQYYLASVKKLPHSGIFQINYPGNYLLHSPCSQFFEYFKLELPYPAKQYINTLDFRIREFQVTDEELISFCFCIDLPGSDDPIFGDSIAPAKLNAISASRALSQKDNTCYSLTEIILKVSFSTGKITDYCIVHREKLLEAFLRFVFCLDLSSMDGLGDIEVIENLLSDDDGYGLTKVTSASFHYNGFCFRDYFYLYNTFIDTSLSSTSSTVPQTIEIFRSIDAADFYTRCDKSLAVPLKEWKSAVPRNLQHIRGRVFTHVSFERFINEAKIVKQETIVCSDIENKNKLLLIITPRVNQNKRYYDIKVEQLWDPDLLHKNEKIMLTTFLHSCYYPEGQSFDHIDFSVNQYELSIYKKKHQDARTQTQIPIEKYADKHYKVWCIRAPIISLRNWSELVLCTLDEPFRNLFIEAVGESA